MTTSSPEPNVRTGYSVCSICDIGCQLRTTAKDGRVLRIQAHDSPATMPSGCVCHSSVWALAAKIAGKRSRTSRRWTRLPSAWAV